MIEWLGSLDEALLWSIFLLCAVIMAIVPFWSKIRKVLKNTTLEGEGEGVGELGVGLLARIVFGVKF